MISDHQNMNFTDQSRFRNSSKTIFDQSGPFFCCWINYIHFFESLVMLFLAAWPFRSFNSFWCYEVDFIDVNQGFEGRTKLDFDHRIDRIVFFLIHLISVISRLLYDWRRLMTSIISRFSLVISSFIKQSYSDLLSMQIINRTSDPSVFEMIAFRTVFKSNSWAKTYNSKTKTLLIIRLHLMNDQWKILTVSVESTKQIT